MADEGCGCQVILDSQKTADPTSAEVKKEIGTSLAKKWNCPSVCGKEADPQNLTEEQLEAFRAIKRLTGLPIIQETETTADIVFNTCPCYYFDPATKSGKDAKRVHTAMNYKKTGQLMIVEEPLNLMVEAIEIMENSFKVAEANIAKKRQEEQDKKIKEMYGNKD